MRDVETDVLRRVPRVWLTVALGLLAWPTAYIGAYTLRSAWAAFVLYDGLCLLAAAYQIRAYGLVAAQKLSPKTWTLLALAGFAVCVAAFLVIRYAGVSTGLIDPHRIVGVMRAEQAGGTPAAIALICLYFAIANPAVEEMFWRGAIYARLRGASWTFGASAFVSGLLFGSWHWLIVRLFFRPAFALLIVSAIAVAGFVFAWLYERLRSLPALIFIHALAGDVPALIALAYSMGVCGSFQ